MEGWAMTNEVAGVHDFGGLVIGIPTFRRPEQLLKLLETLLPELQGRRAQIVVADNDCGTDAPAVIEAFRARWPDTRCIPVRERGIAQVRNALVAEAGRADPDWNWLVMLDDDGWVTPGWLEKLLGAGVRFDADFVAGQVDGQLPRDANWLARNSLYASRGGQPTGLAKTLKGAQNLAIARKALKLVPQPVFRNEYGASGGEDYDLFRRAALVKARMVWCDEAIVIEPTPAERLTPSSVLHRYSSTGVYMAKIDRTYDGMRPVVITACKGFIGACLRTGIAAVTFSGNDCARYALQVAHFSGRLSALMGVTTSRYVSSSKPIKKPSVV
jgi:hypothetical protein